MNILKLYDIDLKQKQGLVFGCLDPISELYANEPYTGLSHSEPSITVRRTDNVGVALFFPDPHTALSIAEAEKRSKVFLSQVDVVTVASEGCLDVSVSPAVCILRKK